MQTSQKNEAVGSSKDLPDSAQVPNSPPVPMGTQLRPFMCHVAIGCPHEIDNDTITLRRDPSLPGNALGQLARRLEDALNAAVPLPTTKPYGFDDFIAEATASNLTIHDILPRVLERLKEVEKPAQIDDAHIFEHRNSP